MNSILRKSYLYLMASAAAAGMFTGCQKENGVNAGEEISTNLSISLPQTGFTGTKSEENPGDGTLVNRCVMQAFTVTDGNVLVPYGEKATALFSGTTAGFSDIKLIKGRDYAIVLWADHTDDASAGTDFLYDTEELPAISLCDKEGFAINDDSYDAFYGICMIDAEDGIPGSIDKTLTRPLAQLNILTTDTEDLPSQTALAFESGYPVGMNLYTGEIEYALSPMSSSPARLPVAKSDKGTYLGFCYMFAPEDGQHELQGFELSFYDSEGNESSEPYVLERSIGIQANVKTNVYGSI